ncbi:hypothetical protein EAE96_002503 [Botrytis aclada]|nr:hypothetical protein EAE96_002503 [Botrytis aclada]
MLFRLQFSSHYFLEPPKSERAAVCIVFSALVRSNFLQTSMEYHKLMSIFKGPAWYQLHRYKILLGLVSSRDVTERLKMLSSFSNHISGWDRMNQRAIIWWSDLWRYLFELNMLLRDMMGGNQRKMDT